MTTAAGESTSFKKAAITSILVHIVLFLLIILSPYLPKPSRSGFNKYYVPIGFSAGGGGGGGGSSGSNGGGAEENVVETEAPPRETLRDLTLPQNLQEASSSRYPVEKPKRETKRKPEKKAAIKKTQQSSSRSKKSASGTRGGTGSGYRLGIGDGGGGGFGFGSGSQIGLSNFPYNYYTANLYNRISSNWNTSQISAGLKGNFYTDISFKIYKNGQISTVDFEKRSGIRSLDLSALRAVQRASPFPPLPQGYEGEFLVIHLRFEHNK
jgi:protein TonB